MQAYAVCGWICTLLFGLSYFPQLVYTYKTKTVGDISIWLWWTLFVAYLFGFVYGFHLHQLPLIIGYFWGFSCTICYLVMHHRYKGKHNVPIIKRTGSRTAKKI